MSRSTSFIGRIGVLLLVLGVLMIAGCKKEPAFWETLEGDLITCPKGSHICTGISDYPWTHSYITGEFTFKDGSDYQNQWSDAPYDQVNKLFGATDCGELIPSRENSAMTGFRHIAGTDLVELVGYVHREDAFRNGYNFRHANFAVVPRYQAVKVKINVIGNYYRFSADGNSEALLRRFCGDSTFRGRKIGTWFGGQRTAPVTLHIDHKKDVSLSSAFPKNLNLMDDDGLCSKGLDPVNYLKNHPSNLYQQYQAECSGTLQVQSLGCDSNIDSPLYRGTSGNSDPGFRYRITCQ